LVPHCGVVRLVIDNPFAVMGPDQVHLQLAPLAFDASTFEIWGALLNGATLAILPAAYPSLDDIATAIARYRVTTLWPRR
jgi:non-ribosomal peptide synthetase component F